MQCDSVSRSGMLLICKTGNNQLKRKLKKANKTLKNYESESLEKLTNLYTKINELIDIHKPILSDYSFTVFEAEEDFKTHRNRLRKEIKERKIYTLALKHLESSLQYTSIEGEQHLRTLKNTYRRSIKEMNKLIKKRLNSSPPISTIEAKKLKEERFRELLGITKAIKLYSQGLTEITLDQLKIGHQLAEKKAKQDEDALENLQDKVHESQKQEDILRNKIKKLKSLKIKTKIRIKILAKQMRITPIKVEKLGTVKKQVFSYDLLKSTDM